MKIGKKTKQWNYARAKLKKEYESKEITTCELRFNGCVFNNFLSFAHRYKRNDPRCIHDFNGTILACIPCHDRIEYNRELTEKVFKKLRPSTQQN